MDEDSACRQCGSTDFYEDYGRTFCYEGHEQELGLATEQDDADFARQGKIVRRKVAKDKKKVSRTLRGSKAYQLFLQCWQYILWKQCHVLVHDKGLPAELWDIIRDLWTLWLSKLEPRLQDGVLPLDDPQSKDATTTASSGEGSDSEGGDIPRRKGSDCFLYPKLIDTVALLHMSLMMLRRPIRLAATLSWILTEDLPFIRATRFIPATMKDRLPGELQQALDTTKTLPNCDDLQKAVYNRAKWFNTTFGLIMSPINQNLLLLDYVRHLALPLELYTMALRLNTIVGFTFAYTDFTGDVETTRRGPTAYPESQLMSLVVVATKLLFPFDSDTIKRYPKDVNDPMTLRMDWAAWVDAKTTCDEAHDATWKAKGDLKPGSEISTTDHDILKMTDQQLDQYMNWYQRTWIEDAKPQDNRHSQDHDGGISKEILDMFPLHDLPAQNKSLEQYEQDEAEKDARLTERIKKVTSTLKGRRTISEEEELEKEFDILRPGALYPQYRNLDDLEGAGSGVTNNTRLFYEEAAETACLSLKALVLAVNSTEERVEKWLMDKRRKEVFGEGSEDSGESNGTSGNEMESIPETSPPAALARGLGGLSLTSSPRTAVAEADGDGEMAMLSS